MPARGPQENTAANEAGRGGGGARGDKRGRKGRQDSTQLRGGGEACRRGRWGHKALRGGGGRRGAGGPPLLRLSLHGYAEREQRGRTTATRGAGPPVKQGGHLRPSPGACIAGTQGGTGGPRGGGADGRAAGATEGRGRRHDRPSPAQSRGVQRRHAMRGGAGGPHSSRQGARQSDRARGQGHNREIGRCNNGTAPGAKILPSSARRGRNGGARQQGQRRQQRPPCGSRARARACRRRTRKDPAPFLESTPARVPPRVRYCRPQETDKC